MSIEIIQAGSNNIPRITYDPDEDILSITGRSIAERPEVIYNPLDEWIRNHLGRFNQLRVVIFLEYINSGSSKALRCAENAQRIPSASVPGSHHMAL